MYWCLSLVVSVSVRMQYVYWPQASESDIWGYAIKKTQKTATTKRSSMICSESHEVFIQSFVLPWVRRSIGMFLLQLCWLPALIIIIIIIIIIMSVFLERLSMWNMFNCTEQGQTQKYKTHAYKTLRTAGVQTIMMKHPTKQLKNENFKKHKT